MKVNILSKIVLVTVAAHILVLFAKTPAMRSAEGLLAPTFHLKNNSKFAIKVDLKQSGKSVFQLKPATFREIRPGGELAFQIDTSKPTSLEIHYCENEASCKTDLPKAIIARFTEGKTIYIKFDSKNNLVPQKGSTFKKTTSKGYSTENNVTQADISIVRDVARKKVQHWTDK